MKNIKTVITEISNTTSISQKEVKTVIDELIKNIKETAKSGEKFIIHGFGIFEPRESKEKTIKSIKTNEYITVSASKNLKFKMSKTLKDELNDK